jgi:hypothetical protein
MPELTDRDELFADRVAQEVTLKLLDAVSHPDFAEKTIDTYSASIQRAVGRAVIKSGLWIIGAGIVFIGWKTGFFEKLLK